MGLFDRILGFFFKDFGEEAGEEDLYYRKIVKGGIYQDKGARGQTDKLNEIQVWCYTFELDQDPDRAEWLIKKISPDSRYDDYEDKDLSGIGLSVGAIDIGSNWSNEWGYDDTQSFPFSDTEGARYPNWQAGEE